MADDSLIEEMRAAIRGDRERAEQRRRREASPSAVQVAAPPEEAPLPDEGKPAIDREPDVEVVRPRVGGLRWLRRRQDH